MVPPVAGWLCGLGLRGGKRLEEGDTSKDCEAERIWAVFLTRRRVAGKTTGEKIPKSQSHFQMGLLLSCGAKRIWVVIFSIEI